MLRTRKMLSALAAAAVLSTSAFAGVGATIYNAPVASAQVVSNIPATANLHIHKIIGTDSGTPATGAELTPAEVAQLGGTAAEGIQFSAYPVTGIDLTTNDGWTDAAALDVNDFFDGAKTATNLAETAPVDRENVSTATTEANGLAPFNRLETGVYLVIEDDNQTWTNAEGIAQPLAPSEPFLVTVPMTNLDGRGWMDTVHVYPKNQVLEGATKRVGPDPDESQPGSAVGEDINYEIEATIPATGQNGLNAFTFTDRLPAELGTPTNVGVTIGGTNVLDPFDAITETGDFTVETWQVTETESDGSTNVHHVLYVMLTPEGLTEAKAAEGGTITLSFDAPVEATPSGTLDNQAWTSVTDPGLSNGQDPESMFVGAISNAARSIYGEINITKTGSDEDGDGTADSLAGATFELHRCTADGAITGDPIQVDGATQFTTADGETDVDGDGTIETLGTVSISGIHLANVHPTTDGTNYEDLWATQGTQFCLEEITAPDNYSLLPAPVLVDSAEFTYDETTVELVSVDQTVRNVETNAGFTLPMTGGKGFWLIVGAGVVLLVVAGGYYVIARNRSENTN